MNEEIRPTARPTGRVDVPIGSSPGQSPAQAASEPESRFPSERVTGRVSRSRLAVIRRSLSERDVALLRSLQSYGLLRSTHLQQLHFYDHATPESAARVCRSVTRRLAAHRLIEAIERRVGGVRAGSSGTIWRLGPSGQRLLAAANPDAPRPRRREPSLRFLEHRMLVADVACALVTAGYCGELEVLTLTPEPASWRVYSGSSGAREVLKPDLFAVTASGEYEDHWFIEVDRGTESLPTLLRQCAAYERYRRSGREQHSSGVFPRVIWLVPDERRLRRLREALQRERTLDAQLFRVHLHSDVVGIVLGGAS